MYTLHIQRKATSIVTSTFEITNVGLVWGYSINGIEGSGSYGTVANHNISKKKDKNKKFKSLIRHS